MEKPTIFLSHITEEAELASYFRKEIESRFLGLVTVFQSSDQASLPIGRNWLDNVTTALRGCHAILVLCSPNSVTRPWINFECGAGWSRNIEVAPICHSGLRPVDLPVPLSLLQGITANDSSELGKIFRMIAGKLGSSTPDADTEDLAVKVRGFEAEYIDQRDIRVHVEMLKTESPELLASLAGVQADAVTVIRQVPERLIERCRKPLDALQKSGHFAFKYQGTGVDFFGGANGAYGDLTVQFNAKVLAAIIAAARTRAGA